MDLEVGKVYSMAELGQMMGGTALTSEDRIVTDETAWKRMTAGRLQMWLEEAKEAGEIDDETIVCADSDPESNGWHPLRAAVAFGKSPGDRPGEFEDDDAKPAKAVCFGVGY